MLDRAWSLRNNLSAYDAVYGDRVLGLRNWDVEANQPFLQNLHDFEVWQETLGSFQSLAAVSSAPRNVHSPDGRAAEVRGAEVTASIFPLLRAPPLMGRTLLEADEARDAPDVVVISEDLWASRFARDPETSSGSSSSRRSCSRSARRSSDS